MIDIPKTDVSLYTTPVKKPAVTAPTASAASPQTGIDYQPSQSQNVHSRGKTERRKKDRREQQRRQAQRDVILDTRSKQERRRAKRRESDSTDLEADSDVTAKRRGIDVTV